jgi:hypothetical protein
MLSKIVLSRNLIYSVKNLGKLNIRSLSDSIVNHNSPNATIPLVEHYRSTWPEPQPLVEEGKKIIIKPPIRTIGDDKLVFTLKSSFDHGSSIFFPHLKFNPADYKVALQVNTKDLGLNEDELKIFLLMVGPRFNQGKREVKLTTDRFPNRIENKRYLIMLLENLLLETKNIYSISDQYK